MLIFFLSKLEHEVGRKTVDVPLDGLDEGSGFNAVQYGQALSSMVFHPATFRNPDVIMLITEIKKLFGAVDFHNLLIIRSNLVLANFPAPVGTSS